MSWWAWLILGFVLAGAELMTDAAFYLVFAGAAAVCLGLLGLFGVTLPVWGQWIAFSVLALSSMVLFRRKCYDWLRGEVPEIRHAAVGAVVEVDDEIRPGARARVRLQGTEWNAVNVGSASIPRGAGAVVIEIDGVELRITAVSPDVAAR